MNAPAPNHRRDPQPCPGPPDAIILAAGKGTRMGEAGAGLPKVLVEVAGKPMARWVVDACLAAGVNRCVLVVGYEADQVRRLFADDARAGRVCFADQPRQLGTGHAAMMAWPHFQDRPPCDVFVLNGDGPLIRPGTLHTLLDVHRHTGADGTLATAVLDDPTGYGRIVREPDGPDGSPGRLMAIVEQKDATAEQLAIREVNPNYLCYRSEVLFDALGRLGNDNAQGEYYLTDVPALLQREGRRIEVVDAVPAEDVLGVNTPEQRDEVDAILRARAAADHNAVNAAGDRG